ncbi:MAG: TerB family tellurite resistance protein [Muribaculaceae bacterium]|nr:TerB family tellurite resistance protein [Muribaculaceae bacterium]
MDNNLKSHFLALYCMVLADGVIDANELQALYRIGTDGYGLSQKEIMDAISSSGTSFSIPDSLEGKITLLYDMAQIAWADGEIDSTERSLLEKYAVRCGFQEENAQAIADYMLQSVQDSHSVEEVINQITQE